ncbi:MAG TPA: hypothetical protein VE130_13515 [Nitrososphaeraceae archaeon]|jgi:hypothetical protein|nr:hypothetical protein [Nitrososphaeraceae archaeon]
MRGHKVSNETKREIADGQNRDIISKRVRKYWNDRKNKEAGAPKK